MKKHNKRKKNLWSALKVTFVSFMMAFAALSGIYCAKMYTTPYSDEYRHFQSGTLDYAEVSKEKCNILIMGTDKSGLLTDVMMIAQIDPVNRTAFVMSIPRDTNLIYNPNNPSREKRINSVHAIAERERKGSEAAILAVKELTGIPIHHYVKINTKAFIDCIDALGGVEFDVPQRMKYSDPFQDLYIDLQPGLQRLDGDKSEQLVRFRHYPNGDIGRIEVQQKFMHALFSQKLQVKYVGKIYEVYNIIAKNIESSMSPEIAVQCGQELLEIGTGNIKSMILPHEFVEGQSYVRPLKSEIARVRREYFGYDDEGNDVPKVAEE